MKRQKTIPKPVEAAASALAAEPSRMNQAEVVRKREEFGDTIRTPRTEVRLVDLRASPWNPRKRYDTKKLDELAESIRSAGGVLQPLLVRPCGDKVYEIIFGHRRFLAANLAGCETVPVEIRELDDATVLAVQMAENLQRQELSPLEEARGFARMIEVHSISAAAIAEKVGLSRSSVYERLRLLELPPEALTALEEGRLSASTAGLILRVQDSKSRQEFAAEVLQGEHDQADGDASQAPREPLSFRAARALLRESYLLDLKDAPWDLEDAELVPVAGACSTCLKRTGNMSEAESMLGELRPNACTDSGCYRRKQSAFWIVRSCAHAAAGEKVLTSKEAAKVFQAYGFGDRLDHRAGFVDLSERTFSAGGKARTWKAALKGTGVETILAQSPDGKIWELAKRDAAEKAVKPKTREGKAKPSAGELEQRRQRKRAQVAAKKRRAVLAGLCTRPVPVPIVPDVAGERSWNPARELVRVLAQTLLLEASSEPVTEILKIGGKPKGPGWSVHTSAVKKVSACLENPNQVVLEQSALELALACALHKERWAGSDKRTKGLVDSILELAGLKRATLEAAVDKPAAALAKKKKTTASSVSKLAAAIARTHKVMDSGPKKKAKTAARRSKGAR